MCVLGHSKEEEESGSGYYMNSVHVMNRWQVMKEGKTPGICLHECYQVLRVLVIFFCSGFGMIYPRANGPYIQCHSCWLALWISPEINPPLPSYTSQSGLLRTKFVPRLRAPAKSALYYYLQQRHSHHLLAGIRL
jgi:hypothetical protein